LLPLLVQFLIQSLIQILNFLCIMLMCIGWTNT